MDDRICFANVSEKLIAKTLTLVGTCHKTCNVHKFSDCIEDFFAARLLRQLGQTLILHLHASLVGFDGAEGVVGGRCPQCCNCIE